MSSVVARRREAELEGQARAAAYRLVLANIPIGTLLSAQIERWARRSNLEPELVAQALTEVRADLMATFSSLQQQAGNREATLHLTNPVSRDGTDG